MSAIATPDTFANPADPAIRADSERSAASPESSVPDENPSFTMTRARRGWFFQKPIFRWQEHPGFRESILWFYAFGLIHQFSAILVGIGLVGLFFLIHGPSVGFAQALEQHLFEPWLAPWLGGEQLLSLIVLACLYRRRFRRHPSLQDQFRLPNPLHGVMTLMLLLPLGILSTWTYLLAEQGWRWMVERLPVLAGIDRMLTLNAPSMLAGQCPFWVLLIIFAVLPAVGEELIFRGVIGRGLTRKIGIVPGVFLTSIMFGVLHGHPLHAAAVIPLGIALHFLYLTTGSLIAPVLLHFLNNATALFTLTQGNSFHQALDRQRGLMDSPLLVGASMMLVGCLLWGLFQTRRFSASRRMSPVCLGSLIVGGISFASLFCRQLTAN